MLEVRVIAVDAGGMDENRFGGELDAQSAQPAKTPAAIDVGEKNMILLAANDPATLKSIAEGLAHWSPEEPSLEPLGLTA